MGDDSGESSDEDYIPEDEVLSEADESELDLEEEVVNKKIGKEIASSFKALESIVTDGLNARAALDDDGEESLHSLDLN